MSKTICIYCGSRKGEKPEYIEAARRTGELLGKASLRLVYGGGDTGIMGTLASSAIAHGAHVTGIIPNFMIEKEWLHKGIHKVIAVKTMRKRKFLMGELADAFAILPGGPGTMDEFFEMLTLRDVGTHSKPIGILNTNEYYTPLLSMLRHMVTEGFASKKTVGDIVVEEEPQALLDRLMM